MVSGPPLDLGLRFSKRNIYRLGNLVADKFRHAGEELDKIKTKVDLDSWIQRLTEFIQNVCKRTAPAKAAHLKVPWWDQELDIQRKRTSALRARYQRCKNDLERIHRRSIFKIEEAMYKWLIKTKSRESFEKLCVLLTSTNPFDLPYRLATGKTKKQMIYNTVRDERGIKTKSIDQTVSAIVHRLFPDDEATQETPGQLNVRNLVENYRNNTNDSSFTKLEIREIIRSMGKKKSPGLDNINVLMAERIHKKCPAILTGIFNKCLELGIFPTLWKKAKLILLNKPGKDPELVNSYRPICLLSVLSKILDKLLTQRITFLLKSKGMLHRNQHGFRNGKSCETANFELKRSIQKAMMHKFKVCLISLDVAGAFDNVWRQSILEQLILAECPQNIFNLVKDYFKDRSVLFQLGQKQWTFEAQRGVPQGSCSGPLFWNLVAGTALGLVLPSGCQIQAFADDLIIVIRGESKEILTSRCNEAISKIVDWGSAHKLQFNASKTICMPLSYGGRLQRNEPLQVLLQGQPVNIQDQLVYLGVTWDSALTFTPHFKRVRQKVDNLTYKITNIAEKFYWRNNKLFKRIYLGAIEPFMLFGHGAWGHRLHLKTVDRYLNGIQRRPLIKITRAFRTTSTAALQVIAGVLPLSLKAVEVYSKFLLFTINSNATVGDLVLQPKDIENKIDIYDLHPTQWISISFGMEPPTGEDIEIFTDGSKIDDKVAAAMVVFYPGVEIEHKICRLDNTATVFQAETLGLKMALEFIADSVNWHRFHIFSDSRSVLQSLENSKNSSQSIVELKKLYAVVVSMKWVRLHWVKAHVGVTGNERADEYAKLATNQATIDCVCSKSKATITRLIRDELICQWQNRWENCGNGKHTQKYLPKVSFKIKQFSPEITQFLTAHGRFPAYFYRFNLSREYSCCCGGFGSTEHFITECPFTRKYWEKLHYDEDNPSSLLDRNSNLKLIQNIMETVDSIVPQI
ncbi:Putative protein in type-1 retrotransposable element R1DM [Araneus ventricosus]|uniref:Retrovirus-related Pol polyprotein from type-1 retrotransposable element R1 n=1 Tax=Araneus ventricosus TaxID=182803 RepID=A0A4Y2T9R8_ARAVE|nr:Putative protein in type-1 retrotransposable element R1DM [Araneus ventricosus]